MEEDSQPETEVPQLTARLAQRKAEAVSARIDHGAEPTLVIGCDSLLELYGVGYGKPGICVDTHGWISFQAMEGATGPEVGRFG